jgi:hypothetical protein
VKEIVLAPEDGTLAIDVGGDLAGVLLIAATDEAPARDGKCGTPSAIISRRLE